MKENYEQELRKVINSYSIRPADIIDLEGIGRVLGCLIKAIYDGGMEWETFHKIMQEGSERWTVSKVKSVITMYLRVCPRKDYDKALKSFNVEEDLKYVKGCIEGNVQVATNLNKVLFNRMIPYNWHIEGDNLLVRGEWEGYDEQRHVVKVIPGSRFILIRDWKKNLLWIASDGNNLIVRKGETLWRKQ